ncbi:hypothetical protein G4B11_001777 [Aspergillus flavus]|nr:hypothetical protein NYO67_1079 [Aspergillus flavus]QMW38541.1 hypothetical protein G4B11_001777 [Aspergillus flavus]
MPYLQYSTGIYDPVLVEGWVVVDVDVAPGSETLLEVDEELEAEEDCTELEAIDVGKGLEAELRTGFKRTRFAVLLYKEFLPHPGLDSEPGSINWSEENRLPNNRSIAQSVQCAKGVSDSD